MKSAIAAIAAVAAGLFVSNMLGVATAEAPTGTPIRTISVQGIANVPIAQSDSAAAANTVYRQGMAGAIADGQSKAEFLTGKVGAGLGAVQSVVEGGGYIGCTGGSQSEYVEYEGQQPDFGSGPQPNIATSVSAPSAARVTHKTRSKHIKRKRPTAKRAASVSCTLTAQVSLVYTIG
jgi:hypothetical protein